MKIKKADAGITTITTPASKLHIKFAKEGVIDPGSLKYEKLRAKTSRWINSRF